MLRRTDINKAAKILRPVIQTAGSFLEGLNHLIFPAVCKMCGCPAPEQSGGLCKNCWQQLLFDSSGDYCPRCGRDASKYGLINGQCAACQEETIEFDRIARAGVYSGVLRDIVLSYKFNDRTELAQYIKMVATSVFAGCAFKDDIDYIVPVPLHWIRRLHRGYNQSMVIAKACNHSSAKINTDLVRVRYTKRQWNLSQYKRKRNVKDAFAVRDGHDFSSRKICLVDDITTSGATLNECARTLKDAGAEKVFALVLAVAANNKDTKA